MLKLISFPAAFGEPSASPFCVKAMCLLEITGVDWTPKYSSDPRKTPNGKFPILIDGGKTIADSDGIRAHLESNYNIDFDKDLTPEQRAVSRSVIRMVEEHLYFALVSDRWLDEGNWPHVKKEFFDGIPALMHGFIATMIRNKTRAQVTAQGMARHSVKEQIARAAKDIDAIKTLLGDKLFLFGDTPTAADMSVVPILRGVLKTPTQTGLRDLITNDQVLLAYLDRGREAMYPA